MNGSQVPSLIIFILFILCSAYFASSETAFTSISRVRLKNDMKVGDKRARKVLDLQEKFESLLSTILVGNNLVNVASSAIATVFFVEVFPAYGAVIAVIVTTALLLIFGEITPKLFGRLSPETVAKLSAPILNVLLIILKPIVWLLDAWKRLVKRLVRVEESESISEEELLSFVDEARVEGSIEYEEHRLVKAAIEFDDVDVETILTPRVDVVGIDIEDSDEVIERVFERNPFSRLIVYDDSVDDVVGILHEKDFHRYLKAKSKKQLKVSTIVNLLSDVLFVPPVMALSDLLRLMQRDKNHMAVVVDEHGGMIGIATMEDALEELVGEIWDETDVVKKEIEEIEKDKIYLIKGSYSLDKMFKLFNLENADEWLSNTVSGFVIEQLERVPTTNDRFEYQDLLFIVTKAQNRRVKEVRVERLKQSDNNENFEETIEK